MPCERTQARLYGWRFWKVIMSQWPLSLQLGNSPRQLWLILFDTVMSVQRFEKQAVDCTSKCTVIDLSSQHMHMGNTNLSRINDIFSLREGPTLFQSEHSKVLFNLILAVFYHFRNYFFISFQIIYFKMLLLSLFVLLCNVAKLWIVAFHFSQVMLSIDFCVEQCLL